MPTKPFQSTPAERGTPLETRIGLATEEMTRAVRVSKADIQSAIDRETHRTVAKSVFDQLAKDGIHVKNKRVLDDGAGLGAVSVEAAMRGALVTAIEPGHASCSITATRLEHFGRDAYCASGEALPFANDCFDLVVSIQVLEHVTNPRRYLAEAFRVLKPGGHLYLSCENYLAFREPHYDVFWLPLMPKWLGAWYLKLRGRNPAFLLDSVTYVTVPGVLRGLHACGFDHLRERRIAERVGSRWLARFIVWGEYLRRVFRAGIYVLVVKPEALPVDHGIRTAPTQG